MFTHQNDHRFTLNIQMNDYTGTYITCPTWFKIDCHTSQKRFIIKSCPSINGGKIIPTKNLIGLQRWPWPTIWEQEVEDECKWEKNFSERSLPKSFCVALYVLHQLIIQPLYGFKGILDYVEQSFLEWVSTINDLLGKVQPEWVICWP